MVAMKRRVSRVPHDDMSVRAKNVTVITAQGDRFWSALQTTPHGYAWTEGEVFGVEGSIGWTRIWFIWQGREYVRTYEGFYGPTWANRLAASFAQEVVNGEVHP